jgi:hypothetical protein
MEKSEVNGDEIRLSPEAMSILERSYLSRFQVTVLGGSISCLVTLMVLDFGRVIYLT